MELTDQVAVVTGAASGIGRALARQLASRGPVALIDISEPALAALADELGAHVSRHVADVADWTRMQAVAREVAERHGRVNLVINNAGVTAQGFFEEQSLDDIRWVMDVNFWGVVHGCRAFLPLLRAARAGWIVNISSLFGLVGVPQQAAYCASKYAVRGLTEALWEELDASHIGVTLVHPGAIATDIIAHARADDSDAKNALLSYFEDAMAPEDAAREILDAVRHRRRRLVITEGAQKADAFKRANPEKHNKILAVNLLKEMGLEP